MIITKRKKITPKLEQIFSTETVHCVHERHFAANCSLYSRTLSLNLNGFFTDLHIWTHSGIQFITKFT